MCAEQQHKKLDTTIFRVSFLHFEMKTINFTRCSQLVECSNSWATFTFVDYYIKGENGALRNFVAPRFDAPAKLTFFFTISRNNRSTFTLSPRETGETPDKRCHKA